MFDPISTVLAVALAVPTVLNKIPLEKRKLRDDAYVSEGLDTNRLVLKVAPEPTNLILQAKSGYVLDRLSLARAEVQEYGNFPNGWDGPRSVAPTELCNQSALEILDRFPAGLPVPVPMMSSNGEIGFYWSASDAYADVNIDPDGLASFFSKDADGKELFVEGLSPDKFDRNWFFANVGPFAAPQFIAA